MDDSGICVFNFKLWNHSSLTMHGPNISIRADFMAITGEISHDHTNLMGSYEK